MRFARTRDAALIESVLSHRTQFPTLATHKGADVFERIAREWICVAAHSDGELMGLYMVAPTASESADIHISLLPAAWGERAVRITQAFLDWLWRTTSIRRLTGRIDATNRLAVRFAERAGMRQTGLITGGLEKNGTTRDLAVFTLIRA